MEAPVATLRRLLAAFEQLLLTQAHLLEGGDAAALRAAQANATTVFNEIIALSRQAEVQAKLSPGDRAQVMRLMQQQQDLVEQIERKKTAVRAELENVSSALSRTYELRSVYGAYRAPARSYSTASFA
jgi:hypothetical protein